jgi:DNA transposition AAA+ family ATPase
MLTASLGLIGVLIGAFVSQTLSASWHRRRERLEALVALVAANTRLIGAHEHLHSLIVYAELTSTSEQAQRAITERSDAHAEWRTAHARTAILIPQNESLHAAIARFARAREAATVWIRDYQRLGSAFSFADYKESEDEAWRAMHRARLDLIAAGQAIAFEDANWLPLLRKQRSKRAQRGLASLTAAHGLALDAPRDQDFMSP